MQLAPYRPMEGDPKYVKINSVKQGTTRQAPNILKRTNNNYSTAVSYILIILLLATAIFITFKLIGSKQIQGEVAKTSTPVYALEAEPIIETKPVEAPQQAPVTEPVIVPPVVKTPVVVEAVQPQVKPITQSHADLMSAAGIPAEQQAAAEILVQRESGWQIGVINSIGCIGLLQNCPDKNGYYWLKEACPNWQNDPVCQLRRFNVYAQQRYGGFVQGLAHSYANNWW